MKQFIIGVLIAPFLLVLVAVALLLSGCNRAQSLDKEIIGSWRIVNPPDDEKP